MVKSDERKKLLADYDISKYELDYDNRYDTSQELLVYKDNYVPLIAYAKKIDDDEIRVGKAMHILLTKLLKEYFIKSNDENYDFHYAKEYANKPVIFIENLLNLPNNNRSVKNKSTTRPFILLLWQSVIVTCIFAFVHKETEFRKYKEVILLIGRKNGKTWLGAAIGLYLEIGDGEIDANVCIASAGEKQADLLYNIAYKLAKTSNQALQNQLEIYKKEIAFPKTDSKFYKIFGSGDSMEGQDLHGVLIDELHVIKERATFDALVKSKSARNQGLTFIMTTAGTVRDGIYDSKMLEYRYLLKQFEADIDDGSYVDNVLPFLFEIDDVKDIEDIRNWYKANPGLGVIHKLDELKDHVIKAKISSASMKDLLTKYFNVVNNEGNAFFDYQTLIIKNEENIEWNMLGIDYGILGLDLSLTTDLTCASILFKSPYFNEYFVRQMYFLPEGRLEEAIKKDNIPYDEYVEQGYMILSKGKIIDYKDIDKWVEKVEQEMDMKIMYVGYDSWNAKRWVYDNIDKYGEENIVSIRQGYNNTSEFNLINELFIDGLIKHNNNPLLLIHLSNVYVEYNSDGNIRMVKKSKNTTQRIDGFAALLNSFAMLYNKQDTKLTYIASNSNHDTSYLQERYTLIDY